MIVSSQLLCHIKWLLTTSRSSHPEVFLVKVVRKIRSKFTGERPCRSVISIMLLYNCIEITLWYWCSSLNLLHIFRTPFSKNTSGWLLLNFCNVSFYKISSDKSQISIENNYLIFGCWNITWKNWMIYDLRVFQTRKVKLRYQVKSCLSENLPFKSIWSFDSLSQTHYSTAVRRVTR